jgi:hypothetical protein
MECREQFGCGAYFCNGSILAPSRTVSLHDHRAVPNFSPSVKCAWDSQPSAHAEAATHYNRRELASRRNF